MGCGSGEILSGRGRSGFLFIFLRGWRFFLPCVKGGLVNGTDEGKEPLVDGATLEGNKGDESAEANKKTDERPLEETGESGGIDDKTDDNAGGELKELFEGHVADEAELIGSDVLRDGVLLDSHGSSIARDKVGSRGEGVV